MVLHYVVFFIFIFYMHFCSNNLIFAKEWRFFILHLSDQNWMMVAGNEAIDEQEVEKCLPGNTLPHCLHR